MLLQKVEGIDTKLLVHLCSIAYEERDQIPFSAQELSKIHFVTHIDGSNAAGFVVDYDGVTAILVFRGTASMLEMLKNIDVRARYTLIGEIPNYLAKAFASIDNESLQFILNYCSGKKVILTGHSKGGGLAVMAASFLVLNGVQPTAVITFASPRTGGNSFVSWWEQNLKNVRCINYLGVGDPVSYWPPKLKEIPFFVWRLIIEIIWLIARSLKMKIRRKAIEKIDR